MLAEEPHAASMVNIGLTASSQALLTLK